LTDHARHDIAEMASPNHGERRGGRDVDLLLLHYTATKSAENAIHWLCNPQSGVSSHYVIDLDGSITRLVDEGRRAWHAGAAYWAGETDINSCSIGIEIQNQGEWAGNPDFPDAQMAALEALCRDIIDRHRIPAHRVLGHSDVAPGRKIDPGPRFDWQRLHDAGIGHWVPPVADADGPGLDLGDEGDAVIELQMRLHDYGYKIEPSGLYDGATKTVVSAFQLHFRQRCCDGVCDAETRATIDRLSQGLGLIA